MNNFFHLFLIEGCRSLLIPLPFPVTFQLSVLYCSSYRCVLFLYVYSCLSLWSVAERPLYMSARSKLQLTVLSTYRHLLRASRDHDPSVRQFVKCVSFSPSQTLILCMSLTDRACIFVPLPLPTTFQVHLSHISRMYDPTSGCIGSVLTDVFVCREEFRASASRFEPKETFLIEYHLRRAQRQLDQLKKGDITHYSKISIKHCMFHSAVCSI